MKFNFYVGFVIIVTIALTCIAYLSDFNFNFASHPCDSHTLELRYSQVHRGIARPSNFSFGNLPVSSVISEDFGNFANVMASNQQLAQNHLSDGEFLPSTHRMQHVRVELDRNNTLPSSTVTL